MLRLSEHYVSTQGEGPRVGLPTQFVRFGGCNLRCPGWPCDSQFAIDIAYRNEWKKVDTYDILKRCLDLRDQTGAYNICLTGGEPFLQPNDDLRELCRALIHDNFTIECFSNGTLPYPIWAIGNGINFVMDWKLKGSGEESVGTDTRWTNLQQLNQSGSNQAVKFVLKDEADLEQAIRHWDSMVKQGIHNVQFYYGRVWQSEWTNAQMIEQVLKRQLPWKLNVQIHNYIWAPHERAR